MGATQLANDCIKGIEESQWPVEGKPNKDNTKIFLEFHVSGKARGAALSLSFKLENKVVDFVSDLKTKLLEKSNSQEMTATAAATKAINICRYCEKPGHHEEWC